MTFDDFVLLLGERPSDLFRCAKKLLKVMAHVSLLSKTSTTGVSVGILRRSRIP